MLAELTELIHAQHVIKSKIKAASADYLAQRASFRARSQIPSDVQLDSWFHTDEMDIMIQLFVQSRPYFLENVGIFPVYCEEGLLQHIQNQIYKKLPKIPLLEWYLEFINIPIKNYNHLIIPLNINQHFRVAIIHIERNDGSKQATIQYYDSTGNDLEDIYQEQLINFFKKFGYIVNYECVSKHEQKENHNCGIFITLKSIDLINEHIGDEQRLLNIENLDGEDYDKFFNHYRFYIAKLIESSGISVTISQTILQKIANHSKATFL